MSIPELYQLFLASNGICTDTRKIEKDTLFFALKGDNFNANEFAQKALEEGCAYAVIDEAEYAKDERFILVDNVLKTLQDLANYHRKQFDVPVLGITGSNGKTTTKELIGAVLSKKYNLLITEGNLNNHLGVPFTLLRLTKAHDFAVIEMGANKPGDIQELCEIAEPNYGMITNVGAAHIEGFGSLEGVIQTKTGMYRWIDQAKGTLFVNADDDTLVSRLPEVGTYTYGEVNGDVKGKVVGMNPFVNFNWSCGDFQSQDLSTKLVGHYNFINFLAAIAVGNFFEVDRDQIGTSLEEYVPTNNRSQIQETERNTLIVDCYNANATSMKAAIDSFIEIDHNDKLAILGDMLELGDISEKEHKAIKNDLVNNQIDAYLVGAEFGKVSGNLASFTNVDELIKDIDFSQISGKLILLKGSRGIKLEKLIEHL